MTRDSVRFGLGRCGWATGFRAVSGTRTGVGGGEFGYHEGTGGGKDAAENKGKGERLPTSSRRVDGHGDDGVDDGSASKDDGHDSGCSSAFVDGGSGTESEHQGERTESARGARDEAPGDAAIRAKGEVGTPHFENQGGGDTDESVGDANKEEGFEASIGGFRAHGHEAAAFVKKHTIDTPGEDGEESKEDPVHAAHRSGEGGWGDG